MTELTLRNKDILKKLDYVKTTVLNSNIKELSKTKRMFSPSDAKENGEKYLTEEWLKKHMNSVTHKGFPVEHYSTPIDNVQYSDPLIKEVNQYAREDFVSELGGNSSAVFLYYPPGGFVGWHTNQNNSGYQFIFSWSEKGDGYFQYYDKKTKEIVKLQDEAGWNGRYYHFGDDDPDHCWHSAYTNVPRMTICVLFRWWDKPHQKELILSMKDQLIEEIESED
tara:strand:- start:64 stop:729 length:666 start_codon:yes stop_codon:yes gene_type:complete